MDQPNNINSLSYQSVYPRHLLYSILSKRGLNSLISKLVVLPFMLLSQLLALHYSSLPQQGEQIITGLALDSRQVKPGDIFFALAGTRSHGEIYLKSALEKGAVAVLKESNTTLLEWLPGNLPCIHLPDLSNIVGEIAARFYGYPSQHQTVIGVTGTNGKTSITHFLAQILHTKAPAGLIGTLGYGIYGALQPATHTTPNAIDLQQLFAQFQAQQVATVVMEVSSHALAQGRVNGIRFDTAVFTNLTRDHLDYHHTMQAYGEAKLQLFTKQGLKTAVVNLDDPFGNNVLTHLASTVTPLTYSLQNNHAEVFARIQAYNSQGCQLTVHTAWGNGQLQTPLFGPFNISNLLATLTVLLNQGWHLTTLLEQMQTLQTVPGRMELLKLAGQPTVIIDYAHTPAALENTLLALREHFKQHILWCVFGCGGDRDQGKRPLMGEIAQRYADKVIITDDNPRHESSQSIINDILRGCPQPQAVIPDRRQAISYALQHAQPSEVVLIAGKGHEQYQQVGEQKLFFSDREYVIQG
jgi:UDP-N-acetylmuramoyl-L-alanyl-D-glutamate--2,6-diaminopimelate ligase